MFKPDLFDVSETNRFNETRFNFEFYTKTINLCNIFDSSF